MGARDIRIRGIANHSVGDTVYFKDSDGHAVSTVVKRLRVEFVDDREFSLYYVTGHGVLPAGSVFYSEADALRS